MTLIDLVRRLATHHPDTITVNGENTTITRGPLLTDLEHAGTASTAARTGSTLGPKIPIDPDALDLAKHIRGELIQDLLRLGATRIDYQQLAPLLLWWHDRYTAASPGGAEIAEWIEQLAHWEEQIRALIEPAKRMPVMGEPCPICGSTRAQDGDDTAVALWIVFHEDAPERTARLECRACKEVLAAGSKAVAATLRISNTNASAVG